MNYVSTHINYEKNVKMVLREEESEGKDKYRTLKVGEYLDIFLTTEQTEKLFDELDEKLHPGKTYSDLQDLNINTEIDLEKANELIEMYQDNK